jgi:apolipoprotein N-acyltransferase
MQTSVGYETSPLKGLPSQADRSALARSRGWLWFAIAAALLAFSNGANTVPLAAWLAPVFLLRFVRGQVLKVGLPAAYLLLGAGFAFQFRGMVPIPGVGYYIFLVFWGIPLALPYIIDRLLARRVNGLTASLVFPAAWAATEYAVSRAPYGTWGSIAYSQYGNLALLQILSVTGLWGITFLIGWFAAVCNRLWEEGLDSKRARGEAWLCAGAIASVMLSGGARIDPELSDAVSGRLAEGRTTSEDRDAIRLWATAIDDDLLSRAEREMQAGAKIVFWGELNAPVLKEDETAFVARGEALATKYHAYLGMSLNVLRGGSAHSIENKLVLIQPNGQVAWEYNKARPVPGLEATLQVPGDGKLRALDTPYGRVSSIICFDGDFPQLLAQAGALRTDVMLDPSSDWRAVDPWHTQMASFRAIEQGFNLIRQTSQGFSAAFDYQGRLLASMDHYQTTDYAMVSQVPTRGVWTIYARLGDWFAWLCLLGVAGLAVVALRKKNRD